MADIKGGLFLSKKIKGFQNLQNSGGPFGLWRVNFSKKEKSSSGMLALDKKIRMQRAIIPYFNSPFSKNSPTAGYYFISIN